MIISMNRSNELSTQAFATHDQWEEGKDDTEVEKTEALKWNPLKRRFQTWKTMTITGSLSITFRLHIIFFIFIQNRLSANQAPDVVSTSFCAVFLLEVMPCNDSILICQTLNLLSASLKPYVDENAIPAEALCHRAPTSDKLTVVLGKSWRIILVLELEWKWVWPQDMSANNYRIWIHNRLLLEIQPAFIYYFGLTPAWPGLGLGR